MTRIGFRNRSAPDCFLNKHFTTKYFTYRQIFAMLLPLILDQFFISIISLLTSAMVSSSSQESVSAVSLVTPVYQMIYAIYSAISSAVTVIIAQYKGHGDEDKMKKAADYLIGCALSFISLSLYLGGFAVFRGVGINGVWICMGLEWFVRSTIFGLRFRSGRWLKQNLYIFAE